MSTDNKVPTRKHKTLHHQQQQHQKMDHRDRAYTSHDLPEKDASQNELTLLMKKPFLKKRSGLFRFYKCLPTMVSTHAQGNTQSSRYNNNNNCNNNHNNIGFSSQSPKNQQNNNGNYGRSLNNNNNTHNSNGPININIHSPHLLGGGHRSTTYNSNNLSLSEMKQVSVLHKNTVGNNNNNINNNSTDNNNHTKNNNTSNSSNVHNKTSHHNNKNNNKNVKGVITKTNSNSDAVEIFEVLEEEIPQPLNNGVNKFSNSAKISSKYNLQLSPNHFEQGDTTQVIGNCNNNIINNHHPRHSNDELSQHHQENQFHANFLNDESDNLRNRQPIQTTDGQRISEFLGGDQVDGRTGQVVNEPNVGTNHHRHRQREAPANNNNKNSSIKSESNPSNNHQNKDLEHDLYCAEELGEEHNDPETLSLSYPKSCISPVDEDDSDIQEIEEIDINGSEDALSCSSSEVEDEHEQFSPLSINNNNSNHSHCHPRHRHHNTNQFNAPVKQLAEQLHNELIGIKNKMQADTSGRKPSIVTSINNNNNNSLSSSLLLHSPISITSNEDSSRGCSMSIKSKNRHANNNRLGQQHNSNSQHSVLEFKSNIINNNNNNNSPSKALQAIATIDSNNNGMERIDRITEFQDIQGSISMSISQKVESLEDEIHIKSKRWCEEQLKIVEKVHSLFTELEGLKIIVKAQQHQVQNLAENVDKEFETVRCEWKESQGMLEDRLKVLESHNGQLLEQLQGNKSINHFLKPTKSTNNKEETRKNKSKDSGELATTDTSHKINKDGTHNSKQSKHSVQVCNQGSQVSPASSFDNGIQSPSILLNLNSSKTPRSTDVLGKNHEDNTLSLHQTHPGHQHTSIDGAIMSGQIVSARKTLLNGDIETVYTNGTREIIKADKSEVRHMYRNGDVRTVVTDGTVTYFYSESSTWQTTYPTGIELFKFPNGVIERRLPNGIIEQTDTEGRVTLFQQASTPSGPGAPPLSKVSSNINGMTMAHGHTTHGLSSIPSVLKSNTNDSSFNNNNNNELSSISINNASLSNHSSTCSSHKVHGLTPSNSTNSNPSTTVGGGHLKLAPGERIIVFENGEEEIHGSDYRRRIFKDGTIKTVYNDGSQETRYSNGRVRIKDSHGVLVCDVTLSNDNTVNNNTTIPNAGGDVSSNNNAGSHHNHKTPKLVRDFGA